MTQRAVIVMPRRDLEKHPKSVMDGLKFVFEDDKMDTAAYVVADSISQGNAEIGEILHATARMEDGDIESFNGEWWLLAERVEARADACMEKGHRVSAAETFMRASRYYFASLFWTDPRRPEKKLRMDRFRSCFRKGAALLDPPMETIYVPFEGKKLLGYFWPAAKDGRKRKTLIVTDGADGWSEWQYYNFAQALHKRDYNFMTVDLPGQGSTPDDELYHRADMEVPGKAVVNWAISRPEVDPERLAVMGEGLGGYIWPRIAMHDKRIKACIGVPVCDMAKVKVQPNSSAASLGKGITFYITLLRVVAWRNGNKEGMNLPDDAYIRMLTQSTSSPIVGNPQKTPTEVNPRADWTLEGKLITCPLLSLLGESEQDNLSGAYEAVMADTPHPKSRVIVTPSDLGAGARIQMGNKSVSNQEAFDWLDEVFGV